MAMATLINFNKAVVIDMNFVALREYLLVEWAADRSLMITQNGEGTVDVI